MRIWHSEREHRVAVQKPLAHLFIERYELMLAFATTSNALQAISFDEWIFDE